MPPKKVKPAGRAAPAPQSSTPKTAKKAPKKASAASKKAPKTSYIRNLHNAAGGSRIDLTDGRRIHLEPRGQVGDVLLVSDDDRDDPVYQRNLGILYEELTREQGLEVVDKQNTNAQAPRPGVMDHMTNEKGEKYVQTQPTITATYESQGQVVGQISPAAEGQHVTHTGNIERAMGPEEVQVPGSRSVFDPDIVPAGLSVEQAQAYIATPREQRQDFLARLQGTEDLGLRASVGPVQREG
jgi:hypothetical protein